MSDCTAAHQAVSCLQPGTHKQQCHCGRQPALLHWVPQSAEQLAQLLGVQLAVMLGVQQLERPSQLVGLVLAGIALLQKSWFSKGCGTAQ